MKSTVPERYFSWSNFSMTPTTTSVYEEALPLTPTAFYSWKVSLSIQVTDINWEQWPPPPALPPLTLEPRLEEAQPRAICLTSSSYRDSCSFCCTVARVWSSKRNRNIGKAIICLLFWSLSVQGRLLTIGCLCNINIQVQQQREEVLYTSWLTLCICAYTSPPLGMRVAHGLWWEKWEGTTRSLSPAPPRGNGSITEPSGA